MPAASPHPQFLANQHELHRRRVGYTAPNRPSKSHNGGTPHVLSHARSSDEAPFSSSAVTMWSPAAVVPIQRPVVSQVELTSRGWLTFCIVNGDRVAANSRTVAPTTGENGGRASRRRSSGHSTLARGVTFVSIVFHVIDRSSNFSQHTSSRLPLFSCTTTGRSANHSSLSRFHTTQMPAIFSPTTERSRSAYFESWSSAGRKSGLHPET